MLLVFDERPVYEIALVVITAVATRFSCLACSSVVQEHLAVAQALSGYEASTI